MKQPLVAVALCYGAGLVLGHFLEAPLLATFSITFSLLVTALFSRRLRPLLLPLLLFLFGWLNMSERMAVLSPHDLRTLIQDRTELLEVRGRLTESPSQRVTMLRDTEKSHTLGEIEVSEIRLRRDDWQPAFGRMMSRTSGVLASNLVRGQAVEITGVALEPPPPIVEGVFDYRRYLRLRGIHYELKIESAKEWKIFGPTNSLPIDERFRAWGQRTLARGLPEQDESLRLQWAMLLGWQTALTAEVSEPFMRSGTMHIFAISGLHIALIAGVFMAVFRALAIPRSFCGAIVIPIIWFYTAATGWQASAIRSTVMMTVIILGWSLKRPTSLLNSLATAACIILVWQPEQLFQASFQLSFFVVLSIALLSPPIEKFRARMFRLDPMLPYELRPRWERAAIKMSKVVWMCFATSLAAFIGSMPLIAYYFHLFTPGSLLANLVVVPVSSFALMSGVGALVTGDFIPVLTEWFNNSGWFFMRAMIWLSEGAANLPAAWFHVRAPGALLFVLYYGVLLAMCAGWFAHRMRRWIVIVTAVSLCGIWFSNWRQERTWHQVTVLPFYTAHAVHVQPARGEPDVLINCGDRSAVDFTLKPFLQANGVNRIGRMIMTHGDARYVGGASHLNEMFRVRETITSPIAFRSSRYREILAELEKGTRLQRCATNGLTLPPWKILFPETSDHFSLAGDNAVVALGTFDQARILFVSGLGKAGQNAVFARHPDLHADVVVAGLPDDGGPLATEWLEAIRPALVVLADSPSRRANPALLARLRRAGAHVITTRAAGAVTLSVRESGWRVETAWPMDTTEVEIELRAAQ